MNRPVSRRHFLQNTAAAGLAFTGLNTLAACSRSIDSINKNGMQLGLVTYLWGKDWDLPTLLGNCEQAGFTGVELRCQHKHGVEVNLSPADREDVKKKFADSAVTCVGYGSNQEFHSPDPLQLQEQIEGSYELIKLCHDIGASGLKVKPNFLPPQVEPEKTMAQIAESLNKIGKFAQDYGQEIRVEVHGRQTQQPKNMRTIFDNVNEPNVKMCWNCNSQDLDEPGLEYNFNMLKPDFGSTVHIREMDSEDYPYQQLFDLFTSIDYSGWILLEARRAVDESEKIAKMQEQLALFNELISNAKAKLG